MKRDNPNLVNLSQETGRFYLKSGAGSVMKVTINAPTAALKQKPPIKMESP